MTVRSISFACLFALILCLLMCSCRTEDPATLDKDSLSVEELHADYEILRKALWSYHPGLFRYQDSSVVESHFADLRKELDQEMSISAFYLALSRFTVKLKCGHTFCSYFNQKKEIRETLFDRADKLPFTFMLLNGRMIVDKDVSGLLDRGCEVTKISGLPTSIILDSLLVYTKSDGGNMGQKTKALELTGIGEYETFDIYHPLLFPSADSTHEIEFSDVNTRAVKTVKVKCLSRNQRFGLIEKKYGPQVQDFEELWQFKIINDQTAYLKLGSFVTYKTKMDWEKFLSKSFDEIKSREISNLIIDIRDNEGGDDDVNLALTHELAIERIQLPAFDQLLRYEKVSNDMRPYLKTWDDRFYDGTGKIDPLSNGFYKLKEEYRTQYIEQNDEAYSGKVILLVNAANSSATFYTTQILEESGRATTVGTETGGNQRGTNGGTMFFLSLPNSSLEIDLPLISYVPKSDMPDAGIMPDILISSTLEDIMSNRDVGLETALSICADSRR